MEAIRIEIGDVVQLDPGIFGGVRFGIVRDKIGHELVIQDRPHNETTSDTRRISVDACERIGPAVWIEN